MTDNEPSSELRACVDIDARERSSGRIALKSSSVAGGGGMGVWNSRPIVSLSVYSSCGLALNVQVKRVAQVRCRFSRRFENQLGQ